MSILPLSRGRIRLLPTEFASISSSSSTACNSGGSSPTNHGTSNGMSSSIVTKRSNRAIEFAPFKYSFAPKWSSSPILVVARTTICADSAFMFAASRNFLLRKPSSGFSRNPTSLTAFNVPEHTSKHSHMRCR